MTQGLNGNDWKTGYREGFADGYAQAKKEAWPSSIGWGTPNGWGTANPVAAVRGTPTGGLSGGYAVNKPAPDYKMGVPDIPPTGPFVTGMTVMSDDC